MKELPRVPLRLDGGGPLFIVKPFCHNGAAWDLSRKGDMMSMKERVGRMPIILICVALLLPLSGAASAENMFGVQATVDSIDLKGKWMKVTYEDPDTGKMKQQEVYWDKSTEFIKQGPPPDLKETAAKAEQIMKGVKLYTTITDGGRRGNRLRLDAVRIKP